MSIEATFHAGLAAVERGAALVYHEILATGAQVTAWEAANPALEPLMKQGLDYALSLLTRLGIPADAATLVTEDIIAALKALAATDATVPSVATTTTTTAIAS